MDRGRHNIMMRSTAATAPVSRRRTSRTSLDPVFRSSLTQQQQQQHNNNNKKMMLKKKKIPVAHHTLLLLQASPYASGQFLCHVCWERGSGAHFHCPDCQLDVHVTCCAASSASQDQRRLPLDDPPLLITSTETHFSHASHPLFPIRRSAATPLSIITCDGCGDPLTSSSSSSHPNIIVPSSSSSVVLDDIININSTTTTTTTTHVDVDDTFYRCSRCDFDLCPLCTRAPRFLLHPSHPHVLVLSRTHPPPTDGGGDLEAGDEEELETAPRISSGGGGCTSCDGCGEMMKMHGASSCGGEGEDEDEEEFEEEFEEQGRGGWMMYRCVACNFDVHEACVRLPLKPLLSHIHPDHPLTLLFGHAAAAAVPPNQPCDVCGQHIFAAGRHHLTLLWSTWVYTCSVCRLFIHPTCARVQHHILPPTPAAARYSTARLTRRNASSLVNRAAASLGALATWPASLLYGNSMHMNQQQQLLAMSSSSNNHMSTPRGGGAGGGGHGRGRSGATTNNHSLAQALSTKLNPISARDQDALDRVLALLQSPSQRT